MALMLCGLPNLVGYKAVLVKGEFDSFAVLGSRYALSTKQMAIPSKTLGRA